MTGRGVGARPRRGGLRRRTPGQGARRGGPGAASPGATEERHDVTLLLGPRGSGKTTLLRHLERWAERAPVARLDLAELGQRGAKPIEALAELVFTLRAEKADFPG
ncbi:hypothetical protein NKH77_42195 [Streptomyces sp. M19]